MRPPLRGGPDARSRRQVHDGRMDVASGKRTVAVAVGVLVVAASAGCGGRVEKAGDAAPPRPLVLTLAAHSDDEEEWKPFAAAVSRLSHGTLRIKVLQNWRR